MQRVIPKYESWLKAFPTIQSLAQAIYKELKPFQERRKEFEANPKLVDEIIEKSNEACRRLAEETMREVREKMGLV